MEQKARHNTRIPDTELLRTVSINVCQPCLDNMPGECHYPGCIQWLKGNGERLDFEHRYEILHFENDCWVTYLDGGIV